LIPDQRNLDLKMTLDEGSPQVVMAALNFVPSASLALLSEIRTPSGLDANLN
jgi:hypothetical protein